MKTLIVLSTLLLFFCSCISQTTRNMQSYERASSIQKDREDLLESYGEIRRDQDKQTHEYAVRDQLIGKWQLVSLTFEEGDIPQPTLAIKVSLAATARQNLSLEFFNEYARYGFRGNSFRGNRNSFRGNSRGIQVGGDYDIESLLYVETLYPVITFSRRQGEPIERFLFGEAAQREENDTPFSRALIPGINVSFSKDDVGDELLHLKRSGRMELTPDGWGKTGQIHCIFRKIE